MGGQHGVGPGSILWVRGGVYRYPREKNGPGESGKGFPVKLAGTADKPFIVRAMPGERATIDGGLCVESPARYLWIWDLEITVSDPLPDKPLPKGAEPERPGGGLNIYNGGVGSRYINLVIHGNNQGVKWSIPSTDDELYGCLIYDNGYRGEDRGHGHCVYTQNKGGWRRIADCIMTCSYPGQYTLHACAWTVNDWYAIDNFLVEDNIFYKAPLVIGGTVPARHIRFLRNISYRGNVRMGYPTVQGENEDFEVRDNIVFRGAIEFNACKGVVNTGNLVVPVDGGGAPRKTHAVLTPNKYDPARAHLAVLNWGRQENVNVKTEPFLASGEAYILKNPEDFYGQPKGEGVCREGKIRVPMNREEFGAFVVLKNPASGRSPGPASKGESPRQPASSPFNTPYLKIKP